MAYYGPPYQPDEAPPDIYPPDEMIDAYGASPPEDLGGQAPPEAAYPYPHIEPVQGPLDSAALALYGNVPQVPTRRYQGQPSGLGVGLLTGFARGFSGARTRQISEREKLNAALAQKAHDENAANLAATRAATAVTAARETHKANRLFDIANPEGKGAEDVVTEADAKQLPWLKPAIGWKRSTAVSTFQPETEKDKRAAAREQRQIDAADRANRLASANTVGKLVDDYRMDKAITGYQGVRSNYNTALAGEKQNSGPGDIAIIFSYMRALEPENPNAVREGEFDNAQKATGLLQTVKNLPQQYFAGNRLTREGRRHFLDTMEGVLKSRRPDFELANDQYKRRAESGGIDPSLVIRDFPTPKRLSESEKDRIFREEMGRP
jgi:hypothetical protein